MIPLGTDEPQAGPSVPPPVQARPDPGRDPLAALVAGDPGPFEAFVTAETPLLLCFFQHLGARRAEAEDLTQDTFVKLFETADQYRPDGRFRGWAYRVARNAWIDRTRRASHAPRLVDDGGAPGTGASGEGGNGLAHVLDPSAVDPAAAAEQQEGAGRVARALAALPEHHRLAFELGVVRELPYSDVALALDIPVGTVKSRVFHAVRRLRELLHDASDVLDPRPGGAR